MNVTFRASAEGLPRCPLCLRSTGRRTGESTRDQESGGDAGAGLSLRLTPEPWQTSQERARLAKSDRASQAQRRGPGRPRSAFRPAWGRRDTPLGSLRTRNPALVTSVTVECGAPCARRYRDTGLHRGRGGGRRGDAAIKRARHRFGVKMHKMHTLQTMHILKHLELCARLPRSLLTNARQGRANKSESARRCGGGRGGGKEIRNCVSFICKEMRPQTSSHRQEEE